LLRPGSQLPRTLACRPHRILDQGPKPPFLEYVYGRRSCATRRRDLRSQLERAQTRLNQQSAGPLNGLVDQSLGDLARETLPDGRFRQSFCQKKGVPGPVPETAVTASSRLSSIWMT